jgi:hypothetical protein
VSGYGAVLVLLRIATLVHQEGVIWLCRVYQYQNMVNRTIQYVQYCSMFNIAVCSILQYVQYCSMFNIAVCSICGSSFGVPEDGVAEHVLPVAAGSAHAAQEGLNAAV